MNPYELKEAIRAAVIQRLRSRGWSQAEAGLVARVSQARINDIVCGRIHKGGKYPGRSLDWMIGVAQELGIDVRLSIEAGGK